MESKLDMVTTTVSAGGVAAYVALAIRHVARYDLGFSFQEIRCAAVTIAVVMAAFIVIDVFAKRSGKAE
jgi:hypothetical protein